MIGLENCAVDGTLLHSQHHAKSAATCSSASNTIPGWCVEANAEQAAEALKGIVGKRLIYRRIGGAEAA